MAFGFAQVGVQLSPLGGLEKPEDVAEVGFLESMSGLAGSRDRTCKSVGGGMM
jgi:hypothetical protein